MQDGKHLLRKIETFQAEHAAPVARTGVAEAETGLVQGRLAKIE
ncbi:hypothetical protein [Methylobacterium sp. J-030]|nr:hypothetical protein [Methylobacterium sp. J-030]